MICLAGVVGSNMEHAKASALRLTGLSAAVDEVVLRFPDAMMTPARFAPLGMDARESGASGRRERVATSGGLETVDRPAMQGGDVIVGAASMYDPYDENDSDAGGAETASGELYDPIAWTAAIQTGLRDAFAGVRYGRLYHPAFALVEVGGKRAVVKINDVGPLRPGRVIDFSKQTMRYFDPSLKRGVLDDVRVTPLAGSGWTPGPLGPAPAVTVAGS